MAEERQGRPRVVVRVEAGPKPGLVAGPEPGLELGLGPEPGLAAGPERGLAEAEAEAPR
jgi:hypothetical protein